MRTMVTFSIEIDQDHKLVGWLDVPGGKRIPLTREQAVSLLSAAADCCNNKWVQYMAKQAVKTL